jgi:carbamoyltransferase
MNVLGINAVYHESSAALVIDGCIVAAVEEERLTRRKHAKSARVDNPHVLPVNSIEHCLKIGGIQPKDIDRVAYSFSPQMREKQFQVDPHSIPGDWGSEQGERTFGQCLQQLPQELMQLFGDEVASTLTWVPHHAAHAACAFFPSPWETAAILVVDGIGEDASTMMAYGDRHHIQVLKSSPYPHSLGLLWEKISQFLGFSEYDACKVMGLAAYGNPQTFTAPFQDLARLTSDGFFVDCSIAQYRVPTFEPLENLFGDRRLSGKPITQSHKDLAATLQMFTNQAILHLAEQLYHQTQANHLCLVGGVALNCVTNWFVKENSSFAELYIPPGTHDSGTAIGAALAVYHSETSTPGITQLTPYTGPQYENTQYFDVIQQAGLVARLSNNTVAETAQLLATGKLVAWFQGKMEFGPRALGNRSLLADPRNPLVREVLNQKVKHREDFRPFAPSVLAHKAHEWFELGRFSESMKYMLFTCPAQRDKAQFIPAVLHVDNTARVQLVYSDVNPKYFDLIEQFEQITGVPMLLNTSFNDSEPIVCSPQDAIATFKKTLIDVLVLGDYIIERSDQPEGSALIDGELFTLKNRFPVMGGEHD